jgi:hypothetical protein
VISNFLLNIIEINNMPNDAIGQVPPPLHILEVPGSSLETDPSNPKDFHGLFNLFIHIWSINPKWATSFSDPTFCYSKVTLNHKL